MRGKFLSCEEGGVLKEGELFWFLSFWDSQEGRVLREFKALGFQGFRIRKKGGF